MNCKPIKCTAKNIVGMAPDAIFGAYTAPNGRHIGPPGDPNPGDVSSFYTMGEERYGKTSLRRPIAVKIGQFEGLEMGSNFMLECHIGYRPYVVAQDSTVPGAYLGKKVGAGIGWLIRIGPVSDHCAVHVTVSSPRMHSP